jgi:HAD superfamily hydrolase (TIGR01509 family)
MIRAVVFDMDGLMFNTEDIYDAAGQQLLQRRGIEFSHELKMKMMGLPDDKAVEVMKHHCQLREPIAELIEESDKLFWSLLPQHISILPGLLELLELLESRQIPKAVATSSRLLFAQTALNRFQLWDRFRFVLTAEDVTRGKPSPDVYLLAAQKLAIEPGEMLVLEDSVTGSKAAAAAGAVTVAVPNPLCCGEDYSHADYVVDRLDSEVILMLLGHIPPIHSDPNEPGRSVSEIES